ncbi:hypothetical protein [Rhodococcus sp. 1168]|uniref:hypothetical protein n=1 Tax=Rhodococcus sp. 1168 TaxID=2018041 RepID=UPI000A0B37D2|nr:hypothetical protein [Rhodococcus sp. 1168]ORI15801.1 hypothetical protein BJI47_00435 [Rhodococcus sp. 1168]
MTTRHRIRHFLRWTYTNGHTAELTAPWLGREGLPSPIIADDTRWALLRRCLREDAIALELRVAGSLVLLYGHIPTRIVELTRNGSTDF